MNDKIIINTISKIHFILLSALSFIFLILFTGFILLQNGVYVDSISLQNIKAKRLYIKWDEKISLVVKELHITKDKSRDSKTDYDKLFKILKRNMIFTNWFKTIRIEKIFFNEVNGSFTYLDNEKGSLSLSSPDFLLKSSFFSKNELFKIDIESLRSKEKEIFVNGNIVFYINDKLKFTTSIDIDINNDAKLHLHVDGDAKQLSYKISSDRDIKDTRYIVDIFDIDPKVKYWFYDAMVLSSLSIQSINGWFEYDKMDKAYLNLRAKAVANDLVYTYDKKVASVRTSHTNLEFKNGVLYIRPQNAYSYDFFLDRSWLKIDFSKKEEILTLHLLFNGQANKDLLSLLNRYSIKLPFIQNKGELDTNLKLVINLISTDVTALGDLYAKEAQINYLGLDLDIFDAHIFINNTHVKIDNMYAKYKDIATSHVDLNYYGNKSKGTLDFRLESVSLKENDLELNKEKPLHVKYIISPIQDFIEVDKSSWNFKNKKIKVDAMQVPFIMKELTAYIPVTLMDIGTLASAYVSGKILFKPNRVDLDIDLLKFNNDTIALNQAMIPLKLLYDNKLSISSYNDIRFNIGSTEYTLNNITADIENKKINIKNIKLNSDNRLKSNFSVNYDINETKGFIDLHSIEFFDAKLGEIFKSSSDIRFDILTQADKTFINSQEYDIEYILSDNEWRLKLNSINKITENSGIFREYNLDNGYISLYKKNNEKNVKFSADLKYKYKILAANKKPINNYIINGEIDKDTNDISININNSVDIKIQDDIKIQANKIGINIIEITKMFTDKNNTKNTSEPINVHFNSKNCFLYLSKNRQAIADKIELNYVDDILSAHLIHKKGNARFHLNDDIFYLYGKGFNDKFMENLFAFSKFKGGLLDFSINGTTKEYGGVIYAKDTTIKDYKILNNVLAFVNTIPSLVTFSLPGYSTKGLKTKSVYMKFLFKDDIYKISDLFLESKEISIVGLGKASIKKNTINLELNLKTDLGSTVSKIPLVGHILLDKGTVSTSLLVKGALDDPKIETQIVKDIFVAPINIIKRTLLLPFELFKSDNDDEKIEKKK